MKNGDIQLILFRILWKTSMIRIVIGQKKWLKKHIFLYSMIGNSMYIGKDVIEDLNCNKPNEVYMDLTIMVIEIFSIQWSFEKFFILNIQGVPWKLSTMKSSKTTDESVVRCFQMNNLYVLRFFRNGELYVNQIYPNIYRICIQSSMYVYRFFKN